MAVATEGQVIISQSTARQSGGEFLLREQEPVRVKGKSLPVHNYEVLGLQVARERGARAADRRPLVGRDREWQAIHDLTDRILSGETHVLTIVGDVGLGKSRLLEEVIVHWTEEHGAWGIHVSCPSFGRHTPYLPWLDVLRALFGFAPGDSSRVRLRKIETLLRVIDPTWGDWAVLIGRLLGLDVPESDLIRSLDAQTRQRTIFRVVTGLVDRALGERPLLLTIDDLQWADDTSVELVNRVARRVTGRAMLLILAHRPEESLALDVADLPRHTHLRLEELSEEDGLRLLDILLPTTPQMPPHLKRLILDKARGNPLFIDAVAHSLIENYLTLDESTGTYHARTDLEQIEVPDSVNRVIMSRIDRLDESSRNVLRVASVIGQQFEQWLLSAIYPYRRAEGELSERLGELSQREILAGPSYPDLLYLFRHILTREVAYESLLYADRRQLHRRIGESIETQRAGELAEYWEVLAFHFGVAEEWTKALRYHLRAGHKAQEIYANEDAAYHYRQALDAAERVPDSLTNQLEAHEHLGEVLTTVGDYDPALTHNYRAQDLVLAIDVPPEERARRLADLCRKTAAIQEFKSNYALAFNWLYAGLAALTGMEAIEAARIYLMGAGIYHRQGNNAEALTWCHKSLAIAGKLEGREGRSVVAHIYYLLGLIYRRLGDPARTIDYCRQSIEISEQIEDVVGASQAHINLGVGYFEQGDWSSAAEHYVQALEIKRRIGDVYTQAVITLNLGEIYLNRGEIDRATHYNQQSLEMWQELGTTYAIALLHNNMSAVALRRGDAGSAMSLLRRSLELFEQIGSSDFLPEVYRHMAEAHLGLAELDQAMDCAQRSLSLAQEGDMRLEEGAARRVLGQVHMALRDWGSSERELRASLHILGALNSRYQVGQTLFQLGLLYHHQNLCSQADDTLTQAAESRRPQRSLKSWAQASTWSRPGLTSRHHSPTSTGLLPSGAPSTPAAC
jgi:predicted ATPase